MNIGPEQLEIVNERGLHARAAAKFVKTAEQFEAELTVSKGDLEVSGRSIMGLMMLAAAKGSCIAVKADGEEAEAAMLAIRDLVGNAFGEE
jgi:phosphocarrier protein HPr